MVEFAKKCPILLTPEFLRFPEKLITHESTIREKVDGEWTFRYNKDWRNYFAGFQDFNDRYGERYVDV